MAALFSPIHRRGQRIKWGLVSYTAIMFSLVTVQTGISFDISSVFYVDNRELPGVEGVAPPGPLGYQGSTPLPRSAATVVLFTLSNWLADGLLVSSLFDSASTRPDFPLQLLPQLYRCYIIYSRNPWVIAFPCIMYLGSVGTYLGSPGATPRANVDNIVMGMISAYHYAELTSRGWSTVPYFSISLSLNILLTLMIVIRLILYTRNVHAVMGVARIGGFCKSIVTILIESCALYAMNLLLAIVSWVTGSYITAVFLPIFAQTQVRVLPRPQSPDGSSYFMMD